MKRVWIVAIAAVVSLIGMTAAPTQAKNLKKEMKQLSNHREKINRQWARKEARWHRNHPHPTAKAINHLQKWEARKGAKWHKLANREERVHRTMLVKRAHHKH